MVTRLRIYWIVRDMHLYAGLFVSPFVLVFALSVFALVHPSRTPTSAASTERIVRGLDVPAEIGNNTGSARLVAVRHVLDQCIWPGGDGRLVSGSTCRLQSLVIKRMQLKRSRDE